MSTKLDYLIIGGGIVGASTAHAISARYPEKSVAIVEKEATTGLHQSSHNSGVIHAGIYYPPDSFKARLCRAGLAATYEFAAQNGIATKNTGKLLVATTGDEVQRLNALSERAQRNGVAVKDVSQSELAELEPNITGLSAMIVNETGIVDYGEIASALLRNSRARGIFGSEVHEIDERPDFVTVVTPNETLRAKQLIVCGGLQADRLAKLSGLDSDIAIMPFRGDFYVLADRFNSMFSHLIYPVPDPTLPFLGIHLTEHIDGSVSIGPSAMLAFARETYRKLAFNWRDSWDVCRFPGFWKLLCRYPKATAKELAVAASKKRYAEAAQRYCPEIQMSDFVGHRCGIRAQAVNANGELVHDFLFKKTPRMLHVLNAPSPAATAAIPIGCHIVDTI
ncbi:MAG: L-2-hydroxyglutarate oxidase [Gammaproteobacteria bacterium]